MHSRYVKNLASIRQKSVSAYAKGAKCDVKTTSSLADMEQMRGFRKERRE